MSTGSTVTHERSADGSLHSLVLTSGKGNILDDRMCTQLLELLQSIAEDRTGKLLVLSGAGRNFSYGASIQEHFPKQVPRMLGNMRRVIELLRGFPFPTLAAIEGRCLGGGLEVALACGMVFVDENASLAFPEIRLGAFAPFGTVQLLERVPRVIAEELLLSGREFSAVEALRWGMVNRIVADGCMESEVVEFAGNHILGSSAASLRVATEALRAPRPISGDERLAAMERLYLEELMPLEDAREGIQAFLEKRPPRWRNG